MDKSSFVLLVEDERLIIDVLEISLADGGYEVRAVSTAAEAMAVLENEQDSVRALVTDVNLRTPLTGWDIAKRAREINPSLPVIYMTGDSGHEWSSKGVPNSTLIQKPFAPAQIITAVSSMLNAADTNQAV